MVFIAFGANLGNCNQTFCQARELIIARIGEIEAQSSLWETKALLYSDSEAKIQPNYLNAVLAINSKLDHFDILKQLHKIEFELGRRRDQELERWGPRIIDLDLIAVDDLVLCNEQLTLPHSEMHKRDFVLGPLSEIAPDWMHPIYKKSVRELLSECPSNLKIE